MNIFNFRYDMGYCARGAAMAAFSVMTIVNNVSSMNSEQCKLCVNRS